MRQQRNISPMQNQATCGPLHRMMKQKNVSSLFVPRIVRTSAGAQERRPHCQERWEPSHRPPGAAGSVSDRARAALVALELEAPLG